MIYFINELIDTPPVVDKKIPTSQVPKVAGGHMTVTYDPTNFRSKYVDKYTGETLDQAPISDAIVEELDYFNSKVWKLRAKAGAHLCWEQVGAL